MIGIPEGIRRALEESGGGVCTVIAGGIITASLIERDNT